jgi:hypothetical protein
MEIGSSTPNQYSRVAVELTREASYLAPDGGAAIMWEQMDYLLAHAGSSTCCPNCPDCTRLEQVKRYLLQPFQ